jgi:uncharacterized protein (TIGR00297 family)
MALLSAGLLLEQLGTIPGRLVLGLLFSIWLARSSYKKLSLSLSGAIAALLVGTATIGAGYRFGATLLVFFFTSSKLTKYQASFKQKFDGEFRAGGQRDWRQVFANGAVGTLAAVLYMIYSGPSDMCLNFTHKPLSSTLLAVFLGHYAACCGDTWSSEVGVLSVGDPILLTRLCRVPRGTNGAISLLGTAASVAGGAAIGLVFYLVGLLTTTGCAASAQWLLVPLGAAIGCWGSLLDSMMGALLQFSGVNSSGKVVNAPGPGVRHISGVHLLDNNAVNFLSAASAALLCPALAMMLF